MKGKIILIPLKEPKEGMKVVDTKHISGLLVIVAIGAVATTKTAALAPSSCIVWSAEKGVDDMNDRRYVKDFSELQQIAVEYKESVANKFTGSHFEDKTLPLHPDDYEKALSLIGKEVEFGVERVDSTTEPHYPSFKEVAKLITPTPVMYTEEEVFQLILKFRIDKCKEICYRPAVIDWWNENKKK